MAALQVSENWDDDFEFQVEKRKMSTATARSEATENWDDDFEDSRQSPKKIIQRHREESWDDEDDEDENSEFGLFAEEDHTVTAKSRRAALARLSAPSHLPHSPTSSVFSVPTTIHTYSSTAHLRPTSAFALISPSPPIHKERERRRLRKKSRPKPQAVFELVEIPSQERPSFSDVDLPRPASELDSRKTSRSDLSIHERPPLVASAVAETSTGPSNGPVSIPHTPTKGAALLSRIGSVKKWGVRRKRGDSTAPTDANESFPEREPISNVSKWDPRRRKRGESTTPADTIPTGSRPRTEENTTPSQSQSTSYLPTPGRGRRRGGSVTTADVISNDRQNEHDPRLTPRASSSLSSYQQCQQQQRPLPPLPSALSFPLHDEASHPTPRSQPQPRNDSFVSSTRNPTPTAMMTPAKLVKRKSFGFVHLGRGFGGHGGGENEVKGHSRSRDAEEEDGEGKRDVIERAEDQKDKMKYAGLGLGRVGARRGGGVEVNGGGDDECEISGSPPKIEKRVRRQSLSRLLMNQDKESKGKDTDSVLEKEKEDHQKGKGKEGVRSFMGSVRRISLISVGVVGRHKKMKSGGGGFGGGGGDGLPACIPPVPTLLPPALSCASQVSLKILSSTTTSNTDSGQRSTSSHTSTADLRRAASLSSPSGGGDGSGGPTATSAPATPIRSNSSSRRSRPPSISSSTKRHPRTPSRSKSKPRKSEESSQNGGLKAGLDFQREQAPFFYPSEGRDTTLLKTPTKSASSTAAATIPLLPPIELQPPSPPRTATTSHIQRRSRAYTTNEVIEGLELETLLVTPSTSSSLVFFTPTSSLSGNNVGVGAVGVGGILPLPPLSPNKLSPGKSPSQSQQSVSLGRSTAINAAAAVDEVTGLSLASGSGSGGGGGLPRRNSLGDLKIPARISQAQVGLRRDLGMVREFASNVEQLKELQNTYNALVVEVRALLDTHVHLRQRVQLPPQPQPVEKSLSPSATSPKFFTQLKSRPKIRARSNTVGSTTTHSPDVDSASLDVDVTASQVAYKRLIEAFWSINYKYRVSWECAELLIELGSGNGGGDGDGGGMISAPHSAATTSVSAPAIQQHLAGTGEEKIFNLKGRERAITLAGDESIHSTTPPPSPTAQEPQTHCQSQPSSSIASTGSNNMPGGMHSGNATSNGGPPLASPLASPPSMSWRASTGRHDLSQRQLVLLREMLNNNGGASIIGASDNEGGLRPPPPHFPAPAEEDLELCPSTASPYPSPYSQIVNRDWRWGDARNSTITFSEDQESGCGADDGRRDRKMDKEKKRRSGRLGMGGIRDMLRSLKKGHMEELQQIGISNPSEVQSTQQCHGNHHPHGRLPTAVALTQPMMHSTTSLSTESSIGSKSVHNQAQVHQQPNRPPIPRIPSQIRRRGRSSTGPESMGSNKGPLPTSFTPSFFTAPKPSPRRPSLASIFRIGNNKTRPAVLHTGVGVGVGVEDPVTLPSAFSASEHNLSAAQCSSGTTGTGGEYSNSTGEEEEDWDRMDSASDLDAAAIKALGLVDGAYDVSATVRGRAKLKTKAGEKKAGISPYRQNQSSYVNDQHHPPPLPASSSSTGLGNFLARHSIIPKRSFSASQLSILGSAGGDGQQHSPNVPSRLSRHSNFGEQRPTDTADNEPPASFRISSSKSAPTTTHSKLANVNFSASSTPGSSSHPSSSNAKAGSVRSMPPHLVPSSLLPTGLQGQQPSPLSSLPDPKLGMIMTPENIKPLLENAKEVHVKLHECIVEIRALIDNGAAAIGHTGVAHAPPTS